MKKHYGLLSLIFGILSLVAVTLVIPSVLAMVFAILYKQKGERANKREHDFAKAGALMGAVTLGSFCMAMICILLPDSRNAGMLAVAVSIAVWGICLFLYERDWCKKPKPVRNPVKEQIAPKTPDPIVLLDRDNRETLGWSRLSLVYLDQRWQLYAVSSGPGYCSLSEGDGYLELPEDFRCSPTKKGLLEFLMKQEPEFSLSGINVPAELRWFMERRQGFPFPTPEGKKESTTPQQKTQAAKKSPVKFKPPQPKVQPFTAPAGTTSLVIAPLRAPSHSGECEHGFYLVKEKDTWYLEHHTAYAKPGDTTQYSKERTELPEDFFKTGNVDKLKTLIPSSVRFNYLTTRDYGVICALFPENPLTEPFVSCQEANFVPTAQYMCELFQTDMESWVYYDYVGLDVRNGKAYLVHSEVRHVGGAYGSEEFFTAIGYDRVQVLAKKAGKGDAYADLNGNTWESFIPEGRLKEIQRNTAPKPREIPAGKPKGPALCEFFLETHNMHAHHIIYLRKTKQGHRLFSISSTGWHYGLNFRFRPTEGMIRDIMEGRYGHSFNAFDRLLTQTELQAVQVLAQKTPENDREKPSYVSGYYVLEPGIRHDVRTNHWYNLSHTLSSIAQHGCVLTDSGT